MAARPNPGITHRGFAGFWAFIFLQKNGAEQISEYS
jgi:hypothetical protein